MKKHLKKLVWVVPLMAIVIGIFVFQFQKSEVSGQESVLGQEVPNSPQEIRGWNYKATVIGEETGWEFHVKQINFFDKGDWNPIDTSFEKTPSEFRMLDAPFQVFAPLKSEGIVLFKNNEKFDIFTKKAINEEDLDIYFSAQGTNNVDGIKQTGDLMTTAGLQEDVDYVIYPNAWDDADLIYYVHYGTRPSLQKLIRWNTKPTSCTSPTDVVEKIFNISDTPNTAIRHNGKNWNKGETLVVQSGKVSFVKGSRLVEINNFGLWDSNLTYKNSLVERNWQSIDVEIEPILANSYRLKKQIPCSFFDTATYPVYSDASFELESGAEDGQIRIINGGSWQTVHDNTTGVLFETATAVEFATRHDSSFGIFRAWFPFDTSSIGAATVDECLLRLFQNEPTLNTDNDGLDYVQIFEGNQGATLDEVDYDSYGGVADGGATTTPLSDITFDFTDSTSQNHNFDFTCNADGIANIDGSGESLFMGMEGHDVENRTINGGADINSLSVYNSEQTGTATDPKLFATTTAAATSDSATPLIISDFF